MDKLLFQRLPITTGTITRSVSASAEPKGRQTEEISFGQVLQQTMQGSRLTFSKHATQRVAQRGIDLSESRMARLNEGVRLAEEKGLNDTLILVDNTAFLVNVRGNKVITTVNSEELRGNVFTNIDGTVVM